MNETDNGFDFAVADWNTGRGEEKQYQKSLY